MTDDDWRAGYGRLRLAFPPPADTTREVAAARGRVYREALDDLSPVAWRHAVTLALQRERFFPTIALLRDYAADYVAPALPPGPTCPECGGSGFEIVLRGEDAFAQRCQTCRPCRSEA